MCVFSLSFSWVNNFGFVHIKIARYEKKAEITVNEVDGDYQTTTIVKYGIAKEEALSLIENEDEILEILEDLVSEMY